MSVNVIEILKNFGTVLGCIISFTTVCGLIIKPIRKSVIKKISEWSDKEGQNKAIEASQAGRHRTKCRKTSRPRMRCKTRR